MKALIPVCLILVQTALVAVSAPDNAPPELVPAQPDTGFSYPYVLWIPQDMKEASETVLVVETNNTGATDDWEATLKETLKDASGNGLGPMVARYMRLPLLMPVFPRSKTDWQVYTHALDRDTMEIVDGPLKRLDLQLLAMVEDARHRIEEKGPPVHERFLMCGFSASGTFSNRFAFLHPDHLMGVVSGAVNAFPMLPVAEIEGTPMLFPLGVHDLEALTGKSFQVEHWKTLPQMIFMGGEDDNDAVKFDDAYSAQERELIFSLVGEPMHERWLKAQAIYLSQSPKANIFTYGQVGHWTNRQIGLDIANFFDNVLRENGIKPNPTQDTSDRH